LGVCGLFFGGHVFFFGGHVIFFQGEHAAESNFIVEMCAFQEAFPRPLMACGRMITLATQVFVAFEDDFIRLESDDSSG
jgi:hypothetical protein